MASSNGQPRLRSRVSSRSSVGFVPTEDVQDKKTTNTFFKQFSKMTKGASQPHVDLVHTHYCSVFYGLNILA